MKNTYDETGSAKPEMKNTNYDETGSAKPGAEIRDKKMGKIENLQKVSRLTLPQHIAGMEWQAGISFKAGQEDQAALDQLNFDKERMEFWNKIAEAKKTGRMEVVKWIKEHSPLFIAGQDIALSVSNEIKGETSYYPIIEWLEWQAKLKEWGIEDE